MNATTNTTPQPDPGVPMYPVRHKLQYRIDSINVLNFLLLGLIGLVAFLWMFIFVQISTRVPPTHFKLNDQLQIIDSVPLDQEGISKPALLNWVNELLSTAFSFNYSNLDKQPAKMVNYFSEPAMKMYLELLQNDDDFSQIVPGHYVVSVKPTAAPDILSSKSFKGRYAWQIRVPAKIILSNAARKADQNVIIDFLIWRVPVEENPLGIIVANFNRSVTGRSTPRDIPKF